MMIWLVLAVFFDRASLGRWSHDKRFFRQFGQLQAKELLLVRVSQPHDISPWLSDGLIVVYHGLSWEKSRYVTGSNNESHLPGITTISTHPGLSDLMPETEKIWEPHLQSVRAPKSNFHSDFQMARRLLEDHLPRIRNELEVRHKKLPAPKCEGAFCEQILFKKFDTFASNVSSSTCILPQLCRTLQEVETQHGLHVLASSMVEAHDPTAPVTQFPGRLRLWCAMMHFLDSCFWLDEGVSLKISSSSSPHFFVVDFRGPTYEETDLDGDTFHSLLWLQSLLTRLGDASSSTGLLEAKPARFQVRESWGMKEMYMYAPYVSSFKGSTDSKRTRLTFICEAVWSLWSIGRFRPWKRRDTIGMGTGMCYCLIILWVNQPCMEKPVDGWSAWKEKNWCSCLPLQSHTNPIYIGSRHVGLLETIGTVCSRPWPIWRWSQG